MIIGVDKGHTVQNGGVCGACGLLKESVENRPVGNKVIEKLRILGHTVIDCSCDYSKDRDEQLAAIVKKANAQKLDLFLSLHLNAGGGTGAEVYTTNTSGAKSEAKKLIDTYCNRTGFKNRGHKYAEFYVLRHTVAPAMLIEMAFVDTESDFKKWNDLGAELIANAIVEGITGQVVQEKPVENKPIVKEESKLLKNCKKNVVRYGSKGTYVYMLQSILVSLGYNPKGIDGHCGNGCVAAIKAYQRDNGLSVDGSCGPATWTSILTK